jgi:hypothetical protein
MRTVAKVLFTPFSSPACGLVAYADDSVPDDCDSEIEAIFRAIQSQRTIDVVSLDDYLAPKLATHGLEGKVDWDRWAENPTAVRVTVRASVSQK